MALHRLSISFSLSLPHSLSAFNVSQFFYSGPFVSISHTLSFTQSRDSSVGIALGYGLDDRGSRVRFRAGNGNCFLHHRVQNGSGAHPASYPRGTRGSYPWGEAAGA
jgi:hypothetical protein